MSFIYQTKRAIALFLVSFVSISLMAKSVIDIPAKWESAAAVITNQESDFQYIPIEKGKELSLVHSEKFSVLINNETGANDFKFVYFPKGYTVEIKVEGEERSDSYDDGDGDDLKYGEELPYFFKHLFKNQSEFEKVNLGKLSKGDEISVEISMSSTVTTKELLANVDCKSFDGQVITFPTIYPKGGHTVNIKMGKEMFLNFGNQNGGPSLDIKSRLEADTVVFKIEAGQFDAITMQYFAPPARIYATSKFEVAFCPKYKAESATLLLGNPGESNDMYEEAQLKTVVFNRIGLWGSFSKNKKGLDAFLGEVKAKGTDDLIMKYYRGFQSYVYNSGQVEGYNDNMFMGVMLAVLNENEIAYEIVVGPDRRSATLDDMLLNSELIYGLKIQDGKEYFYVFPFTKYTNWNDKEIKLLDQDIFALAPGKKLEESTFNEEDMPESLPAEHRIAVRSKVKLGDGFTAIIVNKNTSYLGSYKREIAPLVVTVPEYHKAMLDKKVYANYAAMRDESAADDKKENRVSYFTSAARSLFDTVEYQRFNVKTTGFEDDEEWLQLNEKFTIPGDDAVKFQIKDSMRVYTVALGKFVESNFKLTTEMLRRQGDVFIDYPQIIDYTLRFEIPEGYAVFAFDGFDAELSTDFASLKSKAEPAGKELKVSTTLVLKKSELTEGEWQQLASILSKFENLANVKVTLAGN